MIDLSSNKTHMDWKTILQMRNATLLPQIEFTMQLRI